MKRARTALGIALVLLGAGLLFSALFAYATTLTPALAADHGPRPSEQEVRAASEPRRYEVPERAVMTLTIEKLGIYDAPVFDSDGFLALNSGVAHVPETAMPWDEDEQKNVYLAGHRYGFPGTRARLIFYELDELRKGDLVVLEGRGERYEYRVVGSLVVDPEDSWVMGEIRGRDLLTLQTCTGPGLKKRLIVRAEKT